MTFRFNEVVFLVLATMASGCGQFERRSPGPQGPPANPITVASAKLQGTWLSSCVSTTTNGTFTRRKLVIQTTPTGQQNSIADTTYAYPTQASCNTIGITQSSSNYNFTIQGPSNTLPSTYIVVYSKPSGNQSDIIQVTDQGLLAVGDASTASGNNGVPTSLSATYIFQRQ